MVILDRGNYRVSNPTFSRIAALKKSGSLFFSNSAGVRRSGLLSIWSGIAAFQYQQQGPVRRCLISLSACQGFADAEQLDLGPSNRPIPLGHGVYCRGEGFYRGKMDAARI